MKKLGTRLLSGCLIMLLSVSTVFGTITSEPEIEPMADYYMAAAATISLSGNTVKVSGGITGKVGVTTKTTVHLILQQYKDGIWLKIDDWTSTGNTVSRSLSKTSIVTKGYKYRAKAVCTAYVGSNKETVTKYSSTVDY